MKLEAEDIIFAREVKKALIDRGSNITQLAQQLGFCRTHVSSVVNGRRPSRVAKAAICEYLGISA